MSSFEPWLSGPTIPFGRRIGCPQRSESQDSTQPAPITSSAETNGSATPAASDAASPRRRRSSAHAPAAIAPAMPMIASQCTSGFVSTARSIVS